jgi:hypothetical protein
MHGLEDSPYSLQREVRFEPGQRTVEEAERIPLGCTLADSHRNLEWTNTEPSNNITISGWEQLYDWAHHKIH